MDEILSQVDVGDIWGIGFKYATWLRDKGINTALQLKNADESLIRAKMGIVGVKLQLELRGESCLAMELLDNPKKGTCVSRSFPQSIDTLPELKEAIASFTHRAAEKLRRQKQAASVITVFARTSPFRDNFYSNSATAELDLSTNYTIELSRVAAQLTESIYRKGQNFKKAAFIVFGNHDARILHQSFHHSPDALETTVKTVTGNLIDYSMFLSEFIKDQNGNPLSLINNLLVFKEQFQGEHHQPLDDAKNLMLLYRRVLENKETIMSEYLKIFKQFRHLPEPVKIIIQQLLEDKIVEKKDLMQAVKDYLG
jgi:hypothetical protein